MSDRSPSRFLFEDLVVVLSTAFWMYGDLPSSTAWFLDVFTLPRVGAENDAYVRPTKFGLFLATPTTDRIMAPVGESFPRLSQFLRFPGSDELANQLTLPREQSFLGAAEHWHRARRSPIEGTNSFEDIERLWSGFEAFFGLGRDVRERSDVVGQHVQRTLPEIAAEPALAEVVRQLLDAAYLARCAHSHGASLCNSMLYIGDHEASVFHVGLDLAEALTRNRLGQRPSRRIGRVRGRLLGPAAIAEAFVALRSVGKVAVWPGSQRVADALRMVSSFDVEGLAFPRPASVTKKRAEAAAATLLLGVMEWASQADLDLAEDDAAFLSDLRAQVADAPDQQGALETAGELLLSEYNLVRDMVGGRANVHGLEIGAAVRALDVLIRLTRG